MSANELSELVVQIKPEGAEETTEALEDSEEAFEDAADTADDSSADLEDFSERFRGALGIAVAALGAASAGLLAKVPLIQSAFAGLGAIITAIGLSIDQLLRDLGFEAVTKGLFDLAGDIAGAEGAAEDLIGTLGLLVSALFLVEIGFKAAAIGAAAFKASLIGGALIEIGSSILALVAGLTLLQGALIAVAVLAAAFAAAYILDIGRTRQVTNEVVDAWVNIYTAGWSTITDVTGDAVQTLIALWDFAKASFIARSKELANGVIRAFTGWVNSAREVVVKGMNDILTRIENTVNQAIQALNTLPNFDMPEISIGRVSQPEDFEAPQAFQPRSQSEIRQEFQGRLAQSGRQTKESLRQFAQTVGEELDGALPDNIKTELDVDGKKVAESTDRWRGRSVGNRGRGGGG